jgi:simple sugar transport system substrate-binding protein
MLTGDPNIDAFYSTNDNGTIGALKGVQATNHIGKTVIFGSDISVPIATAMKQFPKTLVATNAQDPQQMGRVAVQQALTLVNGGKVAQFTTFIPAKVYSSDKPDEVQAWLDAHKDGIP